MLFFGGALNRTFLGIPYYGWVMVFLLIAELLVVSCWIFFFWWKLKPYHGLLWATLKKTGASMIFDYFMHFELITERSGKVIFAEPFKQAQEAENDRTEAPAASLGKVNIDFVFDIDKWTYPNSQAHRVIEDIAITHNDLHPDDQVRTLIKFSRYLYDGKFDGPEYADYTKQLRKYIYVPWSRIKMMYKERDESDTFGFVISLAKTIEKMEQESLNKYAMIFLGFFGILDLLIIAGHFLLSK